MPSMGSFLTFEEVASDGRHVEWKISQIWLFSVEVQPTKQSGWSLGGSRIHVKDSLPMGKVWSTWTSWVYIYNYIYIYFINIYIYFINIYICHKYIYIYISGQIIATSHDLTPKGSLVREIPLFQENLGWWNIIIWPDIYIYIRNLSTF